MTNGTVTVTEAAMIGPHGNSCWLPPEISAIATGTVRSSLVSVNVSAKRNSFQAAMKANSPVVAIAGHINGRNTLVMVTQGVAPSMIAASSSSCGNWRMKVVNTQTVNGRVKMV